MARIGISVTKSTAFRNSTQEFSNVYYYGNGAGSLPDATQAEAILDVIVGIEKTCHSGDVTFVRGRVWSQQGSPGTNNMILQKNLSGTGARATAAMDKERAFLFRVRAGNDSRGQPVYLRKWFHACGSFYSGQTISSGQLQNTAAFSSTDRTNMVGQIASLLSISAGGDTWLLVSKAGRNFGSGEGWVAHQFLEHHQLGDQWRAQ